MLFNDERGATRSPRLRAILNGTVVVGAIAATVAHTASCGAATFSLSVSLAENANLDTAYWANLTEARVKIQVSPRAPEPYMDLIEGYCDSIQLHPISGVVRLDGRDLSASLLDTKTPTDFQNLTPTEIVTLLAKAHGLTPIVASTAANAGRHYGNISNILSLSQFAKLTSDWDVLVELAQASDFDLYVSGTALYFQQRQIAYENPQYIKYSELMDIKMDRLLPLSNGVDLTVLSWNSADQYAVTQTVDTSMARKSSDAGTWPARKYTVMRPNLSAASAQALARRVAQSLSAAAMSIKFTMLGDAAMTVRRPVVLQGTDTIFDRPFKIESLTRSFRSRSGFSQVVRASQGS